MKQQSLVNIGDISSEKANWSRRYTLYDTQNPEENGFELVEKDRSRPLM